MDLEIRDVAELLSVSQERILQWVAEGKIPSYKMQDQHRFSRIEIEEWLLHHRNAPQHMPSGTHHFCLYRALHQGDVIYASATDDKEALIKQVSMSIASKLEVDPLVLSELLIDRERMMSTGLNRGIAVPHTREFLHKGTVDRVFVVYPEHPLDYGALDGQAVHGLFFLFASNDRAHLQLLAKIAHLASGDAFGAMLQKKPSKPELLEFFRTSENGARP